MDVVVYTVLGGEEITMAELAPEYYVPRYNLAAKNMRGGGGAVGWGGMRHNPRRAVKDPQWSEVLVFRGQLFSKGPVYRCEKAWRDHTGSSAFGFPRPTRGATERKISTGP